MGKPLGITVTDPTFDEAEAARRLGVSKATVTRERCAGKIRPYRIGKRVIRYTDKILGDYLETCLSGPATSIDGVSAKKRATKVMARFDQDHLLAQAVFKKPKKD